MGTQKSVIEGGSESVEVSIVAEAHKERKTIVGYVGGNGSCPSLY